MSDYEIVMVILTVLSIIISLILEIIRGKKK